MIRVRISYDKQEDFKKADNIARFVRAIIGPSRTRTTYEKDGRTRIYMTPKTGVKACIKAFPEGYPPSQIEMGNTI